MLRFQPHAHFKQMYEGDALEVSCCALYLPAGLLDLRRPARIGGDGIGQLTIGYAKPGLDGCSLELELMLLAVQHPLLFGIQGDSRVK